MKTCTKCGEAKPLGEYFAHKVNGLQARCKVCLRTQWADWRTANPDEIAKHKRRSALKHQEARNARERAKYAANKAAVLAYQAQWRASNPAARTTATAKWRGTNQGQVNAFAAGRRASKLNATPAWADEALMKDIYAYARIMRESGVDCHVDHSVPLQSKQVCGLHTDANLTVLLAEHNTRKGNRYWPDMASGG